MHLHEVMTLKFILVGNATEHNQAWLRMHMAR